MLCGPDIIPIKFYKYSGLHDYHFTIRNEFPYQDIYSLPGWICLVLRNERWVEILLPFEKFPHETEALSILAKMDGECEREGRYIRIHSAYECVVSEREMEFSSIRHALVHPVTVLTRKNVRDSLQQRFGALKINLRNYHHQKEFYRCIGQMLIATDQEIQRRISFNWKNVVRKK